MTASALSIALVEAAGFATQLAANWLVQSTLVVAVGLLLARALRSRGAAAESVVYRTTLVAALVCPVVTWGMWRAGVTGWSIPTPTVTARAVDPTARTGSPPRAIVEPRSAQRYASKPDARTFNPEGVRPGISGASARANPSFGFARPNASTPPTVVEATIAKKAGTPPAQLQPTMFGWIALLAVGGWALTAAVLTTRLAAAWRELGQLRRRARPADEAVQQACGQIARRLSVQPPPVLQTPYLPSPCLAGVWRPAVLLPECDEGAALEHVLIHELAHLKRGDTLWNLVRRATTSILFFQPLLWILSRRIEASAEEVCDDYVVQLGYDRAVYADRLLTMAELGAAPLAAAGVGIVSFRSMLGRRVARILDPSRPLATRVGGALFAGVLIVATIGVAVVGLVGLAPAAPQEAQGDAGSAGNQAQDESAPDVDGGDTSEGKGESRQVDQSDQLTEMRIRVLDDEGQPLAGAKVFGNRSRPQGVDGERIVNSHLNADDQGIVVLPIDRRTDSTKLWAGMSGYVSEFVWLDRAIGEEDALLPSSYEFRLTRGQKLAGIIVDDTGAPIPGVRVRIRVNASGAVASTGASVSATPRVDTWLSDANTRPPIVTDANGRWSLNNAPPLVEGVEYRFDLKLSHTDYITDENWGDAQRDQGISASDLRAGDATIVLQRGTSITGTVTDSDGNPVTKGWVVWHDEPYFNDGVFETQIGADGGFRTPPLAEDEHPVTVVAPGYAAQRRVVHVGRDSSELHFELKPGNRIEIRFVDTGGNPVPEVGVYLANSSAPNTWNGSNALHNHKHPNVPDYGIQRRADENGVYVWGWAPEEPVKYSVGAKGFAPQEVALVAKSEPHVITLQDARVVVGAVTDARNGEPIDQFQAMPVIVFRPDFFSTRYTDAKQGVDGRYELPLTGGGNPEDRYRVRFEAEGYRSIVSEESFGPNDGRVALNVQLDPAPARAGRVVDGNGRPVAGASVIEGTPTWVPQTRNGAPESYGERIVRTDADGSFRVLASSEPVRLRVLHESGMAEELIAPDENSIGEVQLAPWARVSGRLIQEGEPIGDEWIYFYPLVQRGLGEARFQDSYSARTDAEGRFEMTRLPPVAGGLRAHLGPWRDSPLTSSESLPLELTPGEHRTVVLGGEGATVTGRVVATGREDAPLDQRWSLNYLISRDRGVTPPYSEGFGRLSFDPSGPFQAAWLLDSNWDAWATTRENHFVKLSPDGDLRVAGVAPGAYDLVLRLYEQPAGCLVETIGERVVPVTVPESGDVDLGEIDVPCRIGPRPGSDMRAYEFVDARGRRQLVNDMEGRYVVMHVWASWCAPCLASMPELKAAAERFDDKPVVFVGLNVDADKPQAQGLADRRGWNWAQNYLGDDADLVRQLAISTVPAYYLIGPDGRLVASSSDWREIAKALSNALEPKVSMTP